MGSRSEVEKFVREMRLSQDESNRFQTDAEYAGRHYVCMGSEFSVRKGDLASMVLFNDVTDFVELSDRYDRERLCCGILIIDDYDDILAGMSDESIHMMRAEVEKCLSSWMRDVGGYLRRYDRDKYVVIFEKGYLQGFVDSGFASLGAVKDIHVGDGIQVTISLGLAAECGTVPESFAEAQRCIEIALGRGGDQVVLSRAGTKTFFGNSVREVESESRVKARVSSNALKAAIEHSKRVYITGHTNADFDCLGAALGVYRMCIMFNVQAYMVFENVHSSIREYMDWLRRLDDYKGAFISVDEAAGMADRDCALIVVDANKSSILDARLLIDTVGRVAVIDHHRRGSDYISNAKPLYQEIAASSTSEMVAEMLQYHEKKGVITPVEATAMYMGMIVDTKNFTFKTGVRTFEAAAFLKRNGADIEVARHYTAKTLDRFNLIASVVKGAENVGGGCVIAIVPPATPDSGEVAAQAADTLLSLSGNDASFVIAEGADQIMISARSLGRVNVQIIMEDLGGGGHQTMAGAQLKGQSVSEVRATLIKTIEHRITAE